MKGRLQRKSGLGSDYNLLVTRSFLQPPHYWRWKIAGVVASGTYWFNVTLSPSFAGVFSRKYIVRSSENFMDLANLYYNVFTKRSYFITSLHFFCSHLPIGLSTPSACYKNKHCVLTTRLLEMRIKHVTRAEWPNTRNVIAILLSSVAAGKGFVRCQY